MRFAMLIALREFSENAKTKGFWIGILMLPIVIGIAIAVSTILAGASPARHFVLIDQSGDLGAAFEAEVERLHHQTLLDALAAYARDHVRPDARERLPDVLFSISGGAPTGTGPRAAEAFAAAGGSDAALARLAPLLVEDAPAFEPPQRRLRRVEPPADVDTEADLAVVADRLRPYLTGERKISSRDGPVSLFAAVLIAPDAPARVRRPGGAGGEGGRPGAPRPDGAGEGESPSGGTGAGSAPAPVQYWSSNVSDGDLRGVLARSLNDEIRAREYVARGVGLDVIRAVEQTSIPVESFDPSKAPGEEAVSGADRAASFAPVAFVYLLWISLFTVLQMLLNNTIEERSNRIIEVMLSSVTPSELMMGKLAGIALVGLAMTGTWLLTIFAGIRLYEGAGAEFLTQVLDTLSGTGVLPMFAVYFVLGYLLYAGLFLSIGSLCESIKEAQNLQGPIMLILLVPLLTMTFIVRDPNGTLATVMTWIPLYTPFAMINRAAGDPPLLDVIGSLVLLLAATGLVLWLSGRIFRIGVLRTGQRPKMREVLRWMRGTAEA